MPSPDQIKTDLSTLLPPAQVLTRPIDRIAYASDASLYRLVPQAVVRVRDIEEIQRLFAYSQRSNIPLTFRAAGTSLSGQAITDGILVDISHDWRQAKVLENGETIRLGPGVIGMEANRLLAPLHRRIGPDPASIDAAMLGGIVANNSSGMCCGVAENSYHTLASIVMVLPNGLVLDTADPHCGEQLKAQAPHIHSGLLELKAQIESDPQLRARLRFRYLQKNTNGYALNAFLDYDEPHHILAHLMVGSEGTLGFIAEVTLKTLPSYPVRETGLLIFNTVHEAAAAVFPLRDSGARAIEMMDRAALRSVENEPATASLLKGLPPQAAALLVEYQSNTQDEMEEFREAWHQASREIRLLTPGEFTGDSARQAQLWKIRKGLYPSIGGMRPRGSSVLIEDIGLPVERLADATLDLQALFSRHYYENAIIFGHAKDGNLHFVLTPSFTNERSIRQYAAFMDDVVSLVTKKYDGALKAEHGTGRNMAPFLEQEWGADVTQIMGRLKHLLDPQNLLNPGVIINPDPQAHLDNLKTWATVEEEVDQCVECGFCEPKCPSRDLTLTPRRRIIVRREIARLSQTGEDPALLANLVKDYQYQGLDTCAVDGYCSLPCPMHINTGQLVKRLREEQISPRGHGIAKSIVRHFGKVENALRLGVTAAHMAEKAIGVRGIVGVTRLGEKVLSTTLPKWSRVVPRAYFPGRLPPVPSGVDLIYFPSCIARIMGSSPKKGEAGLIDTVRTVAERAGFCLGVPPDSPGACCGMPFSSKGYRAAFVDMAHHTLHKFWEWSQHGDIPVAIESSSCAYTLLTCREYLSEEDQEKFDQMKLLDPVALLYTYILPRLEVRQLPQDVVLHPNCATVKLDLQERLAEIAKACARSVTVPGNLGCCGYAGDRGLLFPELTASASRSEADEVNQRSYDGYFSSNLTCEMGMSQATGKPYQSIFYLVELASRA